MAARIMAETIAPCPQPLPAPFRGVEAWWCPLDERAFDVARGWLSPAEHARAARFGTPALARRYTVGRASLRWVLGRQLGLEPAHVDIRRGARGRPELAEGAIDFNVSHTRDRALIGLSVLPGTRVGVDVEHAERELDHTRLAGKFLTAAEQARTAGLDEATHRVAFLRAWTCKEAMSKATGEALGAPLRHLAVEFNARDAIGPGVALRLASGPPPYVPEAWELAALKVPDRYLATLALWRPDHGG